MRKTIIMGMTALLALSMGQSVSAESNQSLRGPLILAGAASNEGIIFQDIQGHWAQRDIELMVKRGAVGGYPDGTFRPDVVITKAEFSKMLGDLMDVEGERQAFSDTEGHWAESIINGLVEEGVIVPLEYPDGFNPNTGITRLEMSKMIGRALAKESLLWQEVLEGLQRIQYIDLPFEDEMDMASTDKPYIALTNGAGIVNGYANGRFGSNGLATRAEATVMFSRYLSASEHTPDLTALVGKFEGEPPTIYDLLRKAELAGHDLKAKKVPGEIISYWAGDQAVYFNNIQDMIWDGEKYIALGKVGNFGVPHMFTSIDGLNWEDQGGLPAFGLRYLAYNGHTYMSVGDITPVGGSGAMQLIDATGERIVYEGNGRNQVELSAGSQREINVASSVDGEEWRLISGYHEPGTGGVSWRPDIFFFVDNGKFVLLTSNKAFYSSNGEDFTTEQPYNIRDPYRVTPAGYSYLGAGNSITTGDQKLAYDGEAYYNTTTDYFGFGIMKSIDTINWDFVYFEPRTSFNQFSFYAHRIFINDGKYFVINGDKLLYSEDGINWKTEPFEKSDLFVTDNSYSSPAIYYKGYYFMKAASRDHSFYATKDFKKFIEIEADGHDSTTYSGDIQYVDDKHIVTSFQLYRLAD